MVCRNSLEGMRMATYGDIGPQRCFSSLQILQLRRFALPELVQSGEINMISKVIFLQEVEVFDEKPLKFELNSSSLQKRSKNLIL
jgi:hypothetical protein